MGSNQSFFERLTGTINLNDNADQPAQERQQVSHTDPSQPNMQPNQPNEFNTNDGRNEQFRRQSSQQAAAPENQWDQPQQEEEVGELAVDMYETAEHVVIQTMVAGVRPDKLDVSISRQQCTVSGQRKRPREVPPEDYHVDELYWGHFSRTVNLPAEIEVEAAEASETHGLLTITLPKIAKDKQTTLEVQSS